jgi:Ca2+-binding RTX toxin-like protein
VENLIGGSGDDILTGTAGDNEITGGDGDDILNGNGGNDILDGGEGFDTATYASFAAAVTVDLVALEVTDSLGDVSQLVSIESVVGSGHDDTFLSGLSIGDFTLDGGGGTDTISFAPLQSAVNVNLTTGIATVGLGSNYTLSNFENIIGSGLNDTLRGDAGDNYIFGGNGNDQFVASGGNDILEGGAGTDYFNYLSSVGGAYTITLGSANVFVTDGATINSTLIDIEWIGATSGSDIFHSGPVSRTLTLDGGAGVDTISFATETTQVIANLGGNATGAFGTYNFYNSRMENLIGGSGNDILTGTANNHLSNGNNHIIGGDGDDIINGNGGNDTLDGGDGFDTATFAAVTNNIAVNTGTGSVSYTDSSNNPSSSTLISIEYIILGSGNDTITVGGVGQNLTIDAGNGTDSITFASQTAAVNANLTSTATGAFGTYTFINNSIENLTGGSNNDILTGTSAANVIIGGNGNDIIDGGGGNDRLYGGNGSDTIYGGDGNDIIDDSGSNFANNNANIIDGGDGNDIIFVSLANNTIDGGDGNDTLRYDATSISGNSYGFNSTANLVFTLSADSSSGTVTNGTRTDMFTSIETFYGGNGNDTFRGGSGNDTFYGGNGIDTVDYSGAGAGVTVDLANGITADDGLGGSDTLFGIENVIGSAYNDMIIGSSTDNVLDGGDGDDIFIGSAGNDTLNGRDGFDTIDYTGQTGTITFNMNQNSAVGAAIGSDTYVNMEQILSGSGDDSITSNPGNLFANTILFDMGDGNDSIALSSGTVGTDASTFANLISNVEYLDFRNANTASGDMSIDGDDIVSMTDSNNALRLDINSAFGLDITGGSYTLDVGATVGGVTTYTFLTGITPVAMLEVHVT